MTLQLLSQLVAQGEGPYLEYKQRVPAPERMAKEVTAFANTRGGRLLVGIADEGAAVGVKDAAEEEYALRQALDRYVEPAVELEMLRVRISRKRDVIVVDVPESGTKPHYVTDPAGSQRTAYVRIEDKSVEASREARKLMRRPGNRRDTLMQMGEKEQLLFRYVDQYGRITVAQLARMAGISRSLASQTLVRLTRARLLCHHIHLHEDYFTPGRALESV